MKIAIIGGGLVGLATAYKLRELLPTAEICLLEKEPGFGRHQSTHNSGVLHAGLYYKPGSLKARMAVEGIREMTQFCRDHGISHEICGKVVVAVNEVEKQRLEALGERARQNGLSGLRWLNADELRSREPHVSGQAALLVPEEGIVDYGAVIEKLVELNRASGCNIQSSARVCSIKHHGKQWVIGLKTGEIQADFLINCAGLYCDQISELAGEIRRTRIIPFRGEYFKLKSDRQHLVNHLIYPVPDTQFPFLGVHFTRMIQGWVECGPNAVLATAREGYRMSDFKFGEFLDAVTFPGLWRFMRSHGRMCWDEVRRSFSKELFCASLQRLVPEIRLEDLEPGGSGVRAQAMSPEGTLVQDFEIIERANALHVLNAPSPAATACLSIGGEIALRSARHMG